MATVEHSSERVRQAQDVRLIVDAIPTLAWSARSDGSADFFNQRWLDYAGLSAEHRLVSEFLDRNLEQKDSPPCPKS